MTGLTASASRSPCRRIRRIKMQKRCLALITLFAMTTIFIGTIMNNVVTLDSQEVEVQSATAIDNKSLRLIVIGDTGGIPVFHSTRSQGKTAASMDKLTRYQGLDAIINLGDNVYYTGVEHEFDSRFETSFETPYNYESLEKPWYMLAGNHDHFGNISAQIAYSKYSRKWRFPSLYYTIHLTSPDGATIDIIMIDTIILCGNSRDIQDSGFWRFLFAPSHDPKGPTNVTAAEEEWKWLEYHLNKSSADYLFVGGHYPIHSASSHGPTKCLVERLDPILIKYNVSAYLAGHDHTLQHISYPTGKDERMNYFVSGAGSRSDSSRKHQNTILPPGTIHHHFPKSGTIINQLGVGSGGFIYLVISKEGATFQFKDDEGRQTYSTTLRKRT